MLLVLLLPVCAIWLGCGYVLKLNAFQMVSLVEKRIERFAGYDYFCFQELAVRSNFTRNAIFESNFSFLKVETILKKHTFCVKVQTHGCGEVFSRILGLITLKKLSFSKYELSNKWKIRKKATFGSSDAIPGLHHWILTPFPHPSGRVKGPQNAYAVNPLKRKLPWIFLLSEGPNFLEMRANLCRGEAH